MKMNKMNTIKKLVFAAVFAGVGLCGTAWAQEAAAFEEAKAESAASTVETTYYAWDKAARKITGPHVVQAIPVTDALTTLENGKWYVIRRDEQGGALKRSPLYVSGDVHLILEDGCDMTVDAAHLSKDGDIPAIYLQAPQYLEDTVSSISIYGQEKGNGRLVAIGGSCSAGIGCGQKAIGAGTVNIHGGRIEACGGDKGGAAIGTGIAAQGYFDNRDTEPCTFNVNIYGGQVRATAADGSGAPAIGAGRDNHVPHCALAVMGGEVIAQGDKGNGTPAFGWGANCEMPFDRRAYDYLTFSIGRGLMLLAGPELDDGKAERMAADRYCQLAGEGKRIPCAHITEAPTTKVTVPAVDNASYVISTNGVPMTGINGRATLADREFPGVTEIEVVYTADDGYLLAGKRQWFWFAGRTEQEESSEFTVIPPSAEANSFGSEFVVAQPLTAERKHVYSSGKSKDEQVTFTLNIPQAALASGEAYFWVAFKEITGESGLDEESINKIRIRRDDFLEMVRSAIDRPVGALEAHLNKGDLGSSIYALFNDAAAFYAETGRIADTAADLPATLPNEAESVYVFKTRAGGKGEEDAKVLTVGGCFNTAFNSDRWGNELAGDRIAISYFAWDAAAGKIVKQPAVEAIPLALGAEGQDIVLHGNAWYAVLGNNRNVRSVRVDVGTAHLIVTEGARLDINCGTTVDEDATLAVYSEGDPRDANNQSGDLCFASSSSGPLVWDRISFSGGTLEAHGCYVQCVAWSTRSGEAIRNARTVQYAGRFVCSSARPGYAAINSRVLDFCGGNFNGEANGSNGGCVENVIAGEQDGVRCTLNVHTGAEVRIVHEGIDPGTSSKYSAIDAKLDVRLDSGVYAWSCESYSSTYKLTSVAAYRAKPLYELFFCSSDEEVQPQDYEITAVYDENLKTNGFTLTLPKEELRPGEKWVVAGFDEAFARQCGSKKMPISFDDMIELQYALMIMEGGVIAGVDIFAVDLLEKGFVEDGGAPCYSVISEESDITIPASAKVDMIMVMRADSLNDRLPAYTVGLTTKLQSLADGETAGGGVAMVQQQDFAVNRGADGALTLVLPENETLRSDERWAWMALPAGLPFEGNPLDMFRSEFGSVIPVGGLNFDVFFDEMLGDLCIGSGVTTERTIPLPEGTDLLIVSKTSPGMSVEMGPCEYLCLTFGAAEHLNDPNYSTWPRHDEYFPTEDDFCTVTLPKVEGAEFSVAVDGTEVGYRPDGVYTVQKGSEVRVTVLLTDPENYELRSPSVLVYPNVWSDVTVEPQKIAVVAKTGPSPIADQGFVVRRGADGALTLDMSAEAPLGAGEMWAYATLDKGGYDMMFAETLMSFGDYLWDMMPMTMASSRVGELTLDNHLTLAGAEAMGVTTESTVALPSDAELVFVGRVYDGFSGRFGTPRYYALSLGGARHLTKLQLGAAAEGERWHAARQVRYSAWDGKKVAFGATATAQPLTLDSFADEELVDDAYVRATLHVTSDAFYTAAGVLMDEDRSLVIDVAPGATLSLLIEDGAQFEIDRIHLPATATLNVYGQAAASGTLALYGEDEPAAVIGGYYEEGCGTINVYGGMIAVHDDRGESKTTAIGSCDGAGANGSLNVYGGFVYVLSEGVVAIGGQQVLPVNVRGGKIVVSDGTIGTLNGNTSGLNLGEGYKLTYDAESGEKVEISVADYEKLLATGAAPSYVQIVRPAAITFDAQIADLVAAGRLLVQARCFAGANDKMIGRGGGSRLPEWTEGGGTYRVDCGDSALVVLLMRDTSSLRAPDVRRFSNIEGDIALTLDDLRFREPELVAEQPFEVMHCADGRFRLTPQGELADGEAWLWIAFPNEVATKDFPDTEMTVEDYFAQRFQDLLASKALYVGGMFTGGGKSMFTPEVRPIYNCVQNGLMPQNPFLPTDGFHWGVSREKSVFYAPADSEFAMVFKVYDASIGQLLMGPVKASEPVEEAQAAPVEAAEAKPAVRKAALQQVNNRSGMNVNAELFLMAGCRFTSVTAGAKTQLQALPLEPELLPGDAGNPWKIGVDGAQEPIAYTNDTNTLVIEGVGPFAEPTKKPWLEEGVGPITEIMIKNPETELPDDIFEGLGTPEPIGVDLPDGWTADDLPVPGQPWHGGYVKIEDGHWPLTISNVKFQQRYPWNGLVDITFDLTGSTNVELGVWAKDGSTTIAASNFVGRTDMMFAVESRKTVKLVWDADKDALPGNLTKRVLENATITVGTDSSAGSGSGGKVFRFSGVIPEPMTPWTKSFAISPDIPFGLESGDEIVVETQYTPPVNIDADVYLALCALNPMMAQRFGGIPEPCLAAYKAESGDFAAGVGKFTFVITEEAVEAFKLGWLNLCWGNVKSRLTTQLEAIDRITVTDISVVKAGGGGVGAESAAGLIDLAKGTRVARDIENIVIDPKWGEAASATVLWPKAEAPRTYEQATVEQWNTARLPAGQYEFAYTAGATNYTAAFWLAADNWTVIDHETITGERPVTGEKVLVAGETVIKAGGKLVIEGEPEFVWGGAFKVEDGGRIYAPYFDVVIDPATGLVTLEPKDRPTVTGLRFSQRYPWNGLVDVFFTATYAKDPAAKVWVKLAAKLNGEEKAVKTLYLANDAATTNTQFQVAQGEVHLIWDTMKDVGLENYGELEISAQAALVRMAEGEEEPAEDNILCLTARDGSIDIFPYSALFESKNPYYPDLEYSKDGKTWTKYVPQVSSPIQLKEDESVYLRGNNPNGWNPSDLMQRAKVAGVSGLEASLKIKMKWSGGATVEASGSVMSLIDGKGAAKEIPDEYCFAGLFADDSCLTKAPDLTATTVKDSCYLDMFAGTQVSKIKILTTGDPDMLEDAIFDVIDEIKLKDYGTLVLDSFWKDFGIPPSYNGWRITYADEEDAPEPLCFRATKSKEDFALGIDYQGEHPDSIWIETSSDGINWNRYELGGRGKKPQLIECNTGDSIYVRGMNPKGLTTADNVNSPVRFVTYGRFAVSGNVMSLIDYKKEVTEIPCDYCFYRLFMETSITTAPELPATTLKPYCYMDMFFSCRNLTTGPVLPAECIPKCAYNRLFGGCIMLNLFEFGGNKIEDGSGFPDWLDGVAEYGTIVIYGKGDPEGILKRGSISGIPENWSIASKAVVRMDAGEAGSATAEAK